MSIAQIVEAGIVVNALAVDPSSVVAAGGSKITWPGGEYDAPAGAALIMQAGAGIGWTLSGGVLVAPVAVAPPQAQLQATLIAAAIAACTYLDTQINRTPVHATAFSNVAAAVSANGGAVPTTGALATKLAALAALYGGSTAVFGSLSVALQGASYDNLAALVTLEIAAAAATTAAQLAAALTAFEASLATVYSEITAAGAVITAPAAISIKGINA